MMNTYIFSFLFSPLMVLVLVCAYALNAYILPAVVFFVVLPILDALIGSRPVDWDETTQRELSRHWFLKVVPFTNGVAWLSVWAWGLSVAPEIYSRSLLDFAFWVLGVGIVGGALAITTAHELIHRTNRLLRTLGGVMLSSVCYGVFKVEHVRGHHLNVATDKDPVSAKRGEHVYAFLPRAILGVIVHSFQIEAKRLRNDGRSPWSWRNECTQWLLLTVVFLSGAAAWYGSPGVLYVFGVAMVSIILLELVDYIEHYGLTRTPGERVAPHHSWDHDSVLNNILLLNLQRHADHHAHGGKPFASLINDSTAPKLPASYSAMVLIALVPPLYMRLVHPRLPAKQA